MQSLDPTAQAYSELRLAYGVFNERLFDGQLPACLITLQREKRTYGYFSSKRFGCSAGETADEIALNPEFFGVVSVLDTLQTLAHEMCHLWQAHFGKPGRGRYHNEQWARRMESIGLMPSSTGRPGGRRTGDHMADYLLPGGRLEQTVAHLVSHLGFKLTWYDRRPAPVALYASTSAAEASALPPSLLVPPTADARPLACRVDTGASNRSNRMKFTCPACGANAWGKPGLQLGCLPCGLPLFSEASTLSGNAAAAP